MLQIEIIEAKDTETFMNKVNKRIGELAYERRYTRNVGVKRHSNGSWTGSIIHETMRER